MCSVKWWTDFVRFTARPRLTTHIGQSGPKRATITRGCALISEYKVGSCLHHGQLAKRQRTIDHKATIIGLLPLSCGILLDVELLCSWIISEAMMSAEEGPAVHDVFHLDQCKADGACSLWTVNGILARHFSNACSRSRALRVLCSCCDGRALAYCDCSGMPFCSDHCPVGVTILNP
eukprot:COSAG02_NODE_2474_length_8740_cov_6.957991_3_plen_177_part_00